MIGKIKKLFSSSFTEQELKNILPLVEKINQQDSVYRKMSDHELKSQTAIFKQKIAKGASLDEILIDAFAVCREAGSRILNMRHFDVQLIGGIALHRGLVAEMKTGEGKTLVATLPCYLNGLEGKGAHVITVNDYLAKRDAEWMGQIHRFLGLEVGCITNEISNQERIKNYRADVTYGTNNEFGFDYLRDNMKPSLDLYVQRDLNFAIIDEVDSILIDEARTPLIISGPSEENIDQYHQSNKAVSGLRRELDFILDEKNRSVSLTEDGVIKLEKRLNIENLYAPENLDIVHHIHASLKAHAVFKKDKDYVVKDNEIMIVDEFTGRLMSGRRWSDGIHQAIEAKESVTIQAENQTLATITLQNYFRMYNKLSGMTGTAETEEKEFNKVYGLKVLVIPSNKPVIRDDREDLIYRNEAGKYRAVIEDIKEKHQDKRPVLVGTVSVNKSERVSKLLHREGIPHNVLNAKHHKSEAEIITEAGLPGTVTIATNMAGRGTDIVLSPQVLTAGGLHVIGTERHESRRIDNQLRGRAGRQGDNGSSQFYLSLEDDLLRIFANETIINIMEKLGMDEDEAISDKLVSRTIAKAQKRVELHHFDQREHILKYDDVLNKQREVIYALRRQILEGKELRALISDLSKEFSKDMVSQFIGPASNINTIDWDGLDIAIKESFGIDVINQIKEELKNNKIDANKIGDLIHNQAFSNYKEKVNVIEDDLIKDIERHYLIQSLDYHWKDHLFALDKLREGIHLRGYAQKDPLLEYRREGFALFKMLDKVIKQTALTRLYLMQIKDQEQEENRIKELEIQKQAEIEELDLSGPTLDGDQNKQSMEEKVEFAAKVADKISKGEKLDTNDPNVAAAIAMLRDFQQKKMQQINQAQTNSGEGSGGGGKTAPVKREEKKVGRNEPCHCGSGKKYKQCHGRT